MMKTYKDYSPGHKLYVNRRDLNTAYGGDPIPEWHELTEEEQQRWEKRAEESNASGPVGLF